MEQDNRPIDSAVQPCPCVTHDFQVRLMAAPDVSPRPAWWPVDDAGAYADESMAIALGGVEARQRLDGGGGFQASAIPPGVAQVQFDRFYDDVRADLERRTRIDVD
jgi:hypothetical protein